MKEPDGFVRDQFTDAPGAALSPDERAAAAQVARRLSGELRALVALLPPDQRGASAMSRALSVDRNTCQRLVASLATDEPNEVLLVRLPGVQGLRQLIQAIRTFRSDSVAAEQAAAASAAVDALEALISEVAGSQRRLRQRLEADIEFGADPRGPGDDVNARRSLFRAATEIVGRWSDSIVLTSIIRPVPDNPDQTETVRMQGRFGHIWRASAVPLELAAVTPDVLSLDARPGAPRTTGVAMRTLSARPAQGDTPDSLLTEFCSHPLPKVTTRSSGTQTLHVIDAAETASSRPLDIVIAHRRSTPDRNPATLDPPIGEVSALVVYPTRRMVSDVFLHRDLARRCTPTAELHLGGFSSVAPARRSRWSTRFPGDPPLSCLGSGLQRAATPAYDRYAELASHVFDKVGWDPNQFIGYRCEVVYPIWQAAYCMIFDFSPRQG